MNLYYTVPKQEQGFFLKEILKGKWNISDRLLTRLKKEQSILVNGLFPSMHQIVVAGDQIQVFLDREEDNSNIVPTFMSLNILQENEWYLLLNKPAGIAIHPSCLHYETSLSNGVKYYFDQIGLKKKIRPVNRLDKDTSGVVLFAKNEYLQECIIKQMEKRQVQKEYIAIVSGVIEQKTGTICAPIGRKPNSIIERQVSGAGEKAVTHYQVIRLIRRKYGSKMPTRDRKNSSD